VKAKFAGFYPLTKVELDRLWKEGWFVFDTNILLNLYRYGETSRNEWLAVIADIQDRLWTPHQVALEYQRNRRSTISRLHEQFTALIQIAGFAKFRNAVTRQIEEMRAIVDPAKFLASIEPLFSDFEKEVTDLKSQQLTPGEDDPIREKLDALLKHVGDPYSQVELEKLYAEGERRYKLETPPGFKDSHKDQDAFDHEGRTYKKRYGDLIIWKQTLDWAKANGIKCVIFVTDEKKEDWWLKDEAASGQKLGPRPELAAEMKEAADVELFHLYGPPAFLTYARETLEATVSDATIEEVKEVAEEDEAREERPAIVFTGDAGTDFDHHAFQFSVYIDGELKWCVIAQETVEDYFELGSDARHDEAWQAFQKNRRLIEAAAREAIKNFNIEPDGRIRVGMRELDATSAKRRLESLVQRTEILVGQATELATKLNQPITEFSKSSGTDLASLIDRASAAHEVIADIRSKVPEFVDPVEWERTKVEDGRTGEEIFERLGDLVHDLIRERRRGQG
jgi:hypothetical protein